MELREQIQFKTKEDLANFVGALRTDLIEHRSEWENPTLETFLSAMEAWMEDLDGFYKNNGAPPINQPTWKTFADILIAARMYE
jgi:hypothetical protein